MHTDPSKIAYYDVCVSLPVHNNTRLYFEKSASFNNKLPFCVDAPQS